MKILEKFLLDIEAGSRSCYITPCAYRKSLPFYVESIGHFYANSGYFTEREHFKGYLIIYSVGGQGYIKINNSEYLLGSRSCVLLDRDNYHLYSTSGDYWDMYWVLVEGLSVRSYYQYISESSQLAEDYEGKILSCIEEIMPVKESSEPYHDIKACNLLCGILTEMLFSAKNTALSSGVSAHRSQIAAAVDYIEANYYKPLCADDIMQNIFLSKFYFSRIFKESTGMTPYEYLINHRISVSKRLLQESSLSVYQIAEKVGFNNVNNYIQAFKRMTGATPNQYRIYLP